MKKTVLALVLVMCAQQLVHAQIFQLAAARFNNNNLQNIPRFSWAFPIDFPVAKLSDKGYVLSGIVLKNEGFIVNVDSSIYNARKPGTENTNRFKTNRYKFRTISIGPNVGISYALNENLAIYAQYGVDWNFNYKEKRFGDKKRSNKEIVRSEASSQRINVLNHYVALGIGLRSGPYIFGQYYFRNFFNQKFQETVIVNGNSTLIRPYENLNVTRFNVGISFFTVIKKKE